MAIFTFMTVLNENRIALNLNLKENSFEGIRKLVIVYAKRSGYDFDMIV